MFDFRFMCHDTLDHTFANDAYMVDVSRGCVCTISLPVFVTKVTDLIFSSHLSGLVDVWLCLPPCLCLDFYVDIIKDCFEPDCFSLWALLQPSVTEDWT